ncbi:MAG TPA: NUDIX hydrolase [Pseudomonadales bacterium]
MKFCSICGDAVSKRIPAGDNRERHVCNGCEHIHYQNPKMVVGCLPVWEDKVLLCRRAIEPRHGFWTLPAGFMELNESTLEGALRETREEACADIDHPELYCLYDLPHISQIYLFYRGEVREGRFSAGVESLDARLFTEAEIPWDELAFPIVRTTLQRFFMDRQQGVYPFQAMGGRR